MPGNALISSVMVVATFAWAGYGLLIPSLVITPTFKQIEPAAKVTRLQRLEKQRAVNGMYGAFGGTIAIACNGAMAGVVIYAWYYLAPHSSLTNHPAIPYAIGGFGVVILARFIWGIMRVGMPYRPDYRLTMAACIMYVLFGGIAVLPMF